MDPNNLRPISYDSLKILLQYAKANLRFELSRRIPSMRMTEKAVPLRIDRLIIGIHGIEVDDIKYEAHTIRHFPPNITVSEDLRYNYYEGDWDLDECGFDDFSSETVFTPGDLILQVEGQGPRQKKPIIFGREYFESDNLLLADESKKGSSSVNVQKPKSDKGVESLSQTSPTHTKQETEVAEVKLAPFECLENNVPLPFTKMVQVAIHSKNGSLCWYYSGNFKYYEVRKQLMTWLLGNRKPVIHVRDLVVTNGIIARLPENLRMSVKTLKTQIFSKRRVPVDTNTMLNKLEAIIHNDDRPLEIFDTHSLEEDFDHPMATNAKKLVVSDRWSVFPNTNRLIRVSNRKLHIHTLGLNAYDDIIPLIEDWIETPREIGKCFSFEGSEWSVKQAMIEILRNSDGIGMRGCIKIPVDDYSQISVSMGPEIMERGRPLRVLTIEVEAV